MAQHVQCSGEFYYVEELKGITYFYPQCKWILCSNYANPITKFCCIEHEYNDTIFNASEIARQMFT